MAEITLERAIAFLSSDKLKERSDGLSDLKHILQQNQRSAKLNTLNDKACHKIFESLFRFISAEKSLYNRAVKSSGRSPTVSRLATCASVLRTAVDVFLRNLRSKSVRAIIDHIVDTLTAPGEGLWEPLGMDYMKCLTAILQYPPHVEHLGDADWEKLMDFCIRNLGFHETGDGQSIRNVPPSMSEDLDGSSVRATPSRTTSHLPARRKRMGNKGIIEEVVMCIQLLTASPIAPIQALAEKILGALGECVTSSSIAGSALQTAFNSINTVISKVMFDQSELVRVYLLDLSPVIRRLWTTKFSGLKDEMLVTVMLYMNFLVDSAHREPSNSLHQLAEGLVDTLHSEYLRRSEKEILQLDELIFYSYHAEQIDMPKFGPRLGNNRSEYNWTVVWAIATLLELSDELAARLAVPPKGSEVPSKKQRFTSRVEDTFRDSCSSSGPRRVCALQLIPFLARDKVSLDSKASLVERLIPNILDDNAVVSSWTMIAIASMACNPDANQPALKLHWQQAWELASRALTSQFTCRAACNLMSVILERDLLDYSVLAEATHSMLSSVGLNGPSAISDSSLAFWAKVVRVSTQIGPSPMLNASKQICGWLREAWSLGTISDRIQAAQVAAFARPLNLLNLLLACTNRPFPLPNCPSRGPTGVIGKVWFFLRQNRRLLEYLFRIEGIFIFANPWETEDEFTWEPSPRQDPNDLVVLDLLQTKSEAFLQAWQLLHEDKSHHITADTLQILGSFCIVAVLYTECLPPQHASRSQDLLKNSLRLWNEICSFLESREVSFTHSCLELLSPMLSPSTCFKDSGSSIPKAFCQLLNPLTQILENHRQVQKKYTASHSPEVMDLDDPLLTQNDRIVAQDDIVHSNREALQLFPDLVTFHRHMTIQLSILQKIHPERKPSQQSDHSVLIDYLTGLDEADILAAKSVLPHVYRACSGMDRDALVTLLEDLGEKCLQTYELERCEISICLCIDMMTSFVNSWTLAEGDHLSDSASDIYAWFTEVLIARKKASPRAYIALAELLGSVTSCNAMYSVGDSRPSPRTSLFTILQEGDIAVKFHAADLVPPLFGRYLLSDHDAIFDDVLESLPRDPDWSEGIALRLYILAQLASKWHTLLRRSIYHMFETPAQVPHSVQYAEKCLLHVSKTLGLQDARELFRLFSSQILYTWTETQSIKSMPFSVFGYPSLKEMLIDVQDEIVGQTLMRARDDETIQLANLVHVPFVDLLAGSFYKAEAYSIARDITTPPSQGSQPKGVENRLKKLLGADQFATMIEEHFPRIIATFFRSLDQYEQIERAFAKRPQFSYALDILKQITERSASNNTLPANQQPSFRARYLLDELEFLCRRTGYELETIWTPTLTSFVCRTLLESIHPALGSLHACSVIRKLRILVCLAGPVMLRDYPFEMILHALRQFLTDFHCSEDALGLFWYLLDAGKSYLKENPGFMAGIAVSTFTSLRNFLASSPKDTTQENQFKMVLANAQRFHRWLGEFLEAYRSPNLSGESEVSFRRLIGSSRRISSAGNALKGTDESALLLEVLRDRNSRHSLLSKPISDLVLSILCSDFERPPDGRNDIMGRDEDAVANAVAVWETLQNSEAGDEYRLWAAKVIGRAFAATGKVSDVLSREQDPSMLKAFGFKSSEGVLCQSKANILQVLCDMLQSSNHMEIGLVERTLQLIVSNLANYPEFDHCGHAIPSTLMKALIWSPYQCQAIALPACKAREDEAAVGWDPGLSVNDWARNIALFLSKSASQDPVVGPLNKILNVIPSLAVHLLPYILHDVLLLEIEETPNSRQTMSEIFKQALREVHETTLPHARLVINSILYLRNQPRPRESTIAERDEWLDIDYGEASAAANKCCMHKTSLLFLEIHASRVVTGSRRSSMAKHEPPPNFLHDVFKHIDDPDLYYGIQQEPSLASVMEKLDYETSGIKNLLFQSAQYDSEIQMLGNANPHGVLKALNSSNLQGIASAMFSASGDSKDGLASFDSMVEAATSLRQWDIPVSPSTSSASAIVYRAFQSLNTSSAIPEISSSINECFLETLGLLGSATRSAISLRAAMRVLGIMTEIDDVVSSTSLQQVEEEWQKMTTRNKWLKSEGFNDAGKMLNWQETLFSSIRHKDHLKCAIKLSDRDAQLLEARVIRQSLRIIKDHGVPQASLKAAISLSNLTQPSSLLGINVEGAAMFDLANVLWDQGEMTTSIRMLQQLNGQNDLHKQAIPISRAELLVTLGHHVAEARLEKPDAIIQEYLSPAVKELKGRSEGEEASRVFHGFALFCDQQLQNPDGLEDFKRVEQLRDRKEKEMLALEDMMKKAEGKEKEALRMYRSKTKQWFDLDDREYQRLRRSREAFLQQCLENYLLCLKASDTYNNDVLRFCALWLDKSDSETANTAVSKHIDQVPSRKFASLMNQLSSRLLDNSDDFQGLLFSLIFRICVEHPFHGMYQIFASSKSRGGKDQSSVARFRAAGKLVERLKNDKHIGPTWVAIHNTNISYVRFAVDKPEEKVKSGAKVPLRKLTTGLRLEEEASNHKLPPPTMRIELRPDCDYSNVPRLVKFHPEFTVASGVSAPKIVTALASDGVRYKQLFKGGNDDLRQDAIMEQVFEQVSSLLKVHQATQQRNLGIRTYKVLPLTSNAGIIEFVPNTIPLHDYLMPAHQKYFPRDMKPNVCRKHISDVQGRSLETRVRTYRQVTEHFHPVMRYFFMEKFNNPDDWFSRRLAYTRSTAAISILGHVLGLGDRHGHNILLDERTGEVVHIDLGVAFEQGRVLPVPEVVPFRLTRDLVDGMGITKTEGVFRRCCEFILEALRQESYSIMTILDVLRYDPLYSWTVSPLRMKRMQETQEAGGGAPVLPGTVNKNSANEPSEVDRALTVVAKKLSKTLSVTATVNELIQQATDERNLAVLYCGWAAYA